MEEKRNKKRGLVTIVVPIYNVEKYLNRCLDSIINQSYKNLEILLIDDGSTDKCPEMCDEWAKKESRIRVIHKKNQGLGMARNTGIDNATGEYICFFDSDDYIDKDTIFISYEAAKNNNADVVIFGGAKVDSKGKVYNVQKPCQEFRKFEGKDVKEIFLPEIVTDNYYDEKRIEGALSCCDLMISTQVIENSGWRLVSEREIISEDSYSLLLFYSFVNTVVVIPKVFYFYCQNEGSLTKTYRKDRFEQILDYYNRTTELCNQCGYPSSVIESVNAICFSFTIGLLKTIIIANLSMWEKYREFSKVIRDESFQLIVSSIDLNKQNRKWRIMTILIRLRLVLPCIIAVTVKT